MKKQLLSFLFMLVCAAVFAQNVTLTFTAQDVENHYVQLNRVVVSNLTKGWQETLMWPDTVLVMTATGIEDVETFQETSLRLSQNNPNPFDGTTFVNLQVAELGDVAIEITDITGRIVGANNYSSLQPGIHNIRITLSSAGIYFLTVSQNGRTASVKMVNCGNGGGNAVAVVGIVETFHETSLPQPKHAHRGATENPFEAGDRMEYVGYAVINGEEVESNHVLRQQYASQMLMLSFGNPQGDSLSCPGTPTVVDVDGNIYNTVQIGNQCWTRENLRVTHYSDGTPIPVGTEPYYNSYSFTEPYYYDYSVSGIPLAERGYLYNWPAVMHGDASSNTVSSGVQGVCPTGWHLPSDAEWVVLTDYMGSVSEYQCGGSSNKIAKALASTSWWLNCDDCDHSCAVGYDPSTNNASGFGAVPAGLFICDDIFGSGYSANFWSSTESGSYDAYSRDLSSVSAYVGNYMLSKCTGFSVRCLRDYISLPTITTGTVSAITATTVTCGGNVSFDGGATVTVRGVCWSTSQNPTVSDNHTTDGSGMGSFTSSITGLDASTVYYLRAYATNSEGTAYGEERIFITRMPPCPGVPTVTDHEGNVYNTIKIGNQCWMKENLRTTTSPSTGTYLIPASGTNYTFTGKQAFWYNNDSVTYAPLNYGLLYNWNAAMDTFNTAYEETSVSTDNNNAVSVTFSGHRRGICPVGWHLPSDEEWTDLTSYVSCVPAFQCGGSSSNIAKALVSETGWNSYSYSGECEPGNQSITANNATGFSAVPAGSCGGSSFGNAGDFANFWSATQLANYPDYAYYRYMRDIDATVTRGYVSKRYGYSVRCLRD